MHLFKHNARLSMFKLLSTKSILLFSCFLLFLLAFVGYLMGPNRLFHNQGLQVSVTAKQAFLKASILADSGYYQQATTHLDSVITVAASSQFDLLCKYHQLGDLYHDVVKDYVKCQVYADSFFLVYDKLCHVPTDYEMYWYMLKGRQASLAKDYDKAFLFLYRAKTRLDESLDYRNNQMFTNMLASVLVKNGNTLAALKYYKECYDLGLHHAKASDYERFFAMRYLALNNIGVCYEQLNQPDSALFYYTKALWFINKYSPLYEERLAYYQRARGVAMGNIGGVLLQLKNYKKAKHYLNKSIALNYCPEREIRDAILTKIKLGHYYCLVQQKKSCDAIIKSIDADLENYPSSQASMRLADLKYRFYEVTNNHKLAIHYLKAKTFIADSLKNAERAIYNRDNYLRDLEQAQHQADYELLKQSNQLKSVYLALAVMFLVLTLGVVVLFVNQRKRQKEYIRLVNVTNQKLQNSLNSLEKEQEENKRMTKIIAHDLRSPVASIMGLVNLLNTDELSKEDMRTYLNLAEKSGQKALAFITSVLNTSVDKHATDKQLIDLGELLISCIQINSIQAQRKKQQVTYTPSEVMVSVNEGNIWRVFNNIISNAIKFTPTSGQIKIEIIEEATQVTISIKDNGLGIPAELQAKVFDMFTKAGRLGTEGELSNGLGLAISKQIIEAHGGKIWLKSEPKVGSTFYVRLPRS